ncbi:hydroxyneurosporene-O-methyltransferase [Sphaerisporangium rufum]|uniref:Hydroxyneurosporene-O-methyltransferase n=1 Tax=Sphaerisporangium rufum TaxID=1381558 RepID=A0A919R6F6_9ACTN|nr:methyltransferase [Sphaerisporangium rufum]GII80552.1 hydroxyneurosporene-O-methyltransferase [Sphaerisporangium rufum]
MTDPGTLVWDAIRGGARLAAIRTMVELECAEHLRDGPLAVAELAERCGAHAPSLARVLRTLASMGLLESAGADRYALTPEGATLDREAPLSMRSAVTVTTDECMMYALSSLTETVRTGRSAFVERYGVLYEHLSRNPEFGQEFNDYMTNRAVPMARGVAERYDFTGVETLVDVGGGRGHILAAALRANPHLRGVLYDLAHVVPDAREAFTSWGLADRCEFVAGDFFASAPRGADAYLLGSVIHNWDDTDALRILTNVRAAMREDGRVLLVEIVLPDDDSPHFGKDLDLRMLGIFGQGRERSRGEYAVLLEKAGLGIRQVVGLPFNASLIEATAV